MENEIQGFDNLSNQQSLTDTELENRKKAQSNLWTWVKRKELYWAQNSRFFSWLKEGDRNTKFFQAIASNKKRKNSIAGIEIDGEQIEDPSQIKNEASRCFKKIFKEEFRCRLVFKGLNFNHLTQEQASRLTFPFSHEEIDDIIATCSADKALGPDGFNF